ncbi:hypothetical protein B0H10DRAFT_2044111 [Mycena sp. CBHHK59/15]|nr:hypothetical protein B0H10DRAFT_2044111 [Mycena sp. CBHHK59/15]
MSSPPPPQMVLGPYYFGVVLNTFLYGVLLLQTVIYYQGYKRSLWLRLFVLYLFIVETVNTGICVAMIYEPLIGQFGTDLPMFLFPTYSTQLAYQPHPYTEPFLETAISAPVQFFYAWRIQVILKSYIPSAIICLASLASIAGAYWTGISVHQAQNYLNKSMVDHPALIWSVCAGASDVIITVSLIVSLTRRKTGIKSTDDAINRIVRTAVQTGAITGTFAILDIVLFLAVPNSTLSFVFDFALPKLYSNALISTLNARAGMVQIATEQPGHNVLFSDRRSNGSKPNRPEPTSTSQSGLFFNNPKAPTDFIEMHSDILNLDTVATSYGDPK